jgi:hypothetical protein
MQWYVRTQTNITISGGTRYTAPPASGSTTGLISLSNSATSGTGATLDITYTHAVGAGSFYVHIFASPNMSPGISYVNSVLRDIGFLSLLASGSSQQIFTKWEPRFGNVPRVTGRKIFVLVAVLDQVTGIQSPGILSSAIVT